MERRPPIKRTKADWESLITQFEQSGLKPTAFCKQNALTHSAFYKWKSVFQAQRQGFKKINMPQPNGAGKISFTLPNGLKFEWDSAVSINSLLPILKVFS